MEQNYDGNLKIHVCNMHPKDETLQYFICRGDPLFASQTKQKNMNKKSHFLSTGLRYVDTADPLLKSKLVEHTDFMDREKYEH